MGITFDYEGHVLTVEKTKLGNNTGLKRYQPKAVVNEEIVECVTGSHMAKMLKNKRDF